MTPYLPPSGFSVDDAFCLTPLTSAAAYIEVMLDAERVESGPDTGWVESNQRYSDWLDSQDWDSQQKRVSIDAFLFHDLSRNFAEGAYEVGLSPHELQGWGANQPMQHLGALPATGLYREMVHSRHLNKRTAWMAGPHPR